VWGDRRLDRASARRVDESGNIQARRPPASQPSLSKTRTSAMETASVPQSFPGTGFEKIEELARRHKVA